MTPPAFPSAPSPTSLRAPVTNSESPRSKTTVSVALISTLPAFPLAKVLAEITAPSITERFLAAILISAPVSPSVNRSVEMFSVTVTSP